MFVFLEKSGRCFENVQIPLGMFGYSNSTLLPPSGPLPLQLTLAFVSHITLVPFLWPQHPDSVWGKQLLP